MNVRYLAILFIALASTTAIADPVASSSGQDSANYPEEIGNCEPCKILWLKQQQKGTNTASATPAVEEKPADTPPKKNPGKVVYPKEIETCEPCKRLWLEKRAKELKASQQNTPE